MAGAAVAPDHHLDADRVGGHAYVVSLEGELTLAAASDLELAVERELAAGCAELVLDLTAVPGVRPAAEIVLRQLQVRLESRGCEVAVASAHASVTAALTLSGLTRAWPVSPSRDDALAGLLRRPVA